MSILSFHVFSFWVFVFYAAINSRIFKGETSKINQGLLRKTERYGNAISKIVRRLPNGTDITKAKFGNFALNMKHSLQNSIGVNV